MLCFCLHCDAWSCRCSRIGSMSVSSCIWCMFVSCVHPMAVLNAALCMTCSVAGRLSILASCMTNLSKFPIVFSSVVVVVRLWKEVILFSSITLIRLNKDAFEGHLCQTVNNL